MADERLCSGVCTGWKWQWSTSRSRRDPQQVDTVTTIILCILLILLTISSYNPDSFSCDNQAYGYYADVESGCEVTCLIFSPMIFILSRSSTSVFRLRVRRSRRL